MSSYGVTEATIDSTFFDPRRGALPDRLYLVGTDGTVAFQGDPGPWGFDPAALEAAIESAVGAR